MKLYDTAATSEVIAKSPTAALQVYSNSGRLYNQAAWLYVGTSNVANCTTNTTGTQRKLTVNGSSTTQNFTRNFANSDVVFYLFSEGNKTGNPSNDYFNFIDVKINNGYIGKYVFARKIGDSEIVLYDTLSDKVYHNEGTGHFEEVTI